MARERGGGLCDVHRARVRSWISRQLARCTPGLRAPSFKTLIEASPLHHQFYRYHSGQRAAADETVVNFSFASCSLGLSATSQQYFSLTTNQPLATSQQYSSLRTNQHQPSATRTGSRFGDCRRSYREGQWHRVRFCRGSSSSACIFGAFIQ
jgi:hypothetical protein